MANQVHSEKGEPIPEALVQHSLLQQAQAAAAAQDDSVRPTRQGALLQTTDLITPDPTEGDISPPPYGDVFGEIRNEKDGLGTIASVADDGRVNIRINQLNRRLSQVFAPDLRQHVQSAQNSQPPPPPYIHPSLGSEEGVSPPPSLNIVIQVVGSRGDVQPFVALGKVLKETYGHRVRLATHPNFKKFVQEENGLEFFSIGGDPSQLMAFMVKNPGLMPGFRSMRSGDVGQRRKDVSEYIQGCWRSCYQTGNGMIDNELSEPSSSETEAKPFVADCIIANPPSFAHIHCAEKLGIPLHIMFTMPYSPTQAFPHPLANIQSSNADPQLTNYLSYAMIEVLSWQGLGDIINRFRKKCLGLDAVSMLYAPGMLQRLRVPHTYCWSPALIPKPKDWGSHISISGFYFLNLASNYVPAHDLQAFLDAGPPPVYIGFGSIVLDDPNAMTELIFEATKKTGQRVLLSKGWGGMGADELQARKPDSVFMLGNVPHDWLFKHVSCVVHHGGAGTTAAGISAGRPTLVVPFFGDQPFWGAMVARAGAGPDPIPHKQLTSDKLAEAINFCLRPESLERAKDLASKIASERGSEMGAQSFNQHLEVDRLRCTLAPSRVAVWRIKRTQVRLSAFAACTLANADLLDFHDLKLFRAQEYYTDDGPRDPISGAFTTACRAFGNMGMGIAEVPSETLKALQIRRQHSQASVPTIPSTGESSRAEAISTPPALVTRSQTSLNLHKSPTGTRSPPHTSSRSYSTSNIASSSIPERQISRSDTSSSKNPDMLRQTGAHTSKGIGRFAKALVQSPMEISLSLTKGLHNAPKMWGDDTVRPQERVSDLKSGFKAVGKEFSYGFYDGITGLVTHPWKGAQKEGASGFMKGLGKGIGGIATKPGAAMLGVLGHSMKGVHKEVQKMYGSNVQNYIVASRVAQGYEDWLLSSDADKEDVIVRWKLIQKYLKKKSSLDEMMQDVLQTQQKMNTEGGLTSSYAQSFNNVDFLPRDSDTSTRVRGNAQSNLYPTVTAREGSLGATRSNETRSLANGISRDNVEENISAEQLIQENESQLQRQPQGATDEETLRQAIAFSEAESQRHATQALAYEQELKRAIEQSLSEQTQRSSESEWQMDMRLEHNEYINLNRQVATSKVPEQSAAMQHPNLYDQGHLEGTTQDEFEARMQGEKSTQERTEEDIVMEYVKKQSLLESHHRKKGKDRAAATADVEDEDLQKALELSMREKGSGSRE